MKKIALAGGGKVGEMITELLIDSGRYEITLIDSSEHALTRIPDRRKLTKVNHDVSDTQALVSLLEGHYAVISACPYFLTTAVAQAAARAKIHYLDLTEDVASTDEVRAIARNVPTTFIPQCGLAPGFISIVTTHLAQRFDDLDTLRLRVGALPQFPTNSLTYNLTWSTEGVINEYCEPCYAIVNGENCTIPALTQLESFSLDGVRYESFNTSGGLGTLTESLQGKVKNLSYQTIRYPGHAAIMKTLLHDLKLAERRDLLKDVLEHAVPITYQDVVLIFVTITGTIDGRLIQENYANKIYSREVSGRTWSAIQTTTAASVCAMLELIRMGEISQTGFVRQEDVLLDRFLNTNFGAVYREVNAMPTVSAVG